MARYLASKTALFQAFNAIIGGAKAVGSGAFPSSLWNLQLGATILRGERKLTSTTSAPLSKRFHEALMVLMHHLKKALHPLHRCA